MTEPPDLGRRLFDYFVVVGIGDSAQRDEVFLEAKENGTRRMAPYLKYIFPQRHHNSFLKSISEFCFPDASTTLSKKSLSETFSFVLTETNGEKSFIPCFKMFSQILDEVIKRANDSTGPSFDSCTIFLNAIFKQPLPAPGGTLTIHVPVAMDREDKERYDFTRPDDSDSLLEHVNFEPYLRHMDPFTIVSIFISMIIERRFIFVADRLSTLSTCVQAAVALLYPFSWQHIFIPVLPRSLLTFCCAPMPFCIGILRDSVPELKTMSDAMEEVILVDIDNNKLISPHSVQGDIELVPQSLLDPLLSVVSAKCKEVKSNYSLWSKLSGGLGKAPTKSKEMPLTEAKNLANAFIAFMVDLLGSYRVFLDRGNFDKQAFVGQQLPEFQPFIELVSQSQMFEMFIADRIGRNKQLDQGRFERRVTKREGSGRIRLSRNIDSKPQQGLKSEKMGTPTAIRRSKRVEVECQRSPVVPARSRFTMYENGELTREQITREESEVEGRSRDKDSALPLKEKEKKRELKRSDEDGVEVRDRPQCKYGENCRSDNPHHWVAYRHTPSLKHGDEANNRKRGGKGMGFFLGKLLGEIRDESPSNSDPISQASAAQSVSVMPTSSALSYVSSLLPSESITIYQDFPAGGLRRERARGYERVATLMQESERRRQEAGSASRVSSTNAGVREERRERRDDASLRPPLPRAAVHMLEDERPTCAHGVLCASNDPSHWVNYKHTPDGHE